MAERLRVTDRINVYFDGHPDLVEAIKKHADLIKKNCLIANLVHVPGLPKKPQGEYKGYLVD